MLVFDASTLILLAKIELLGDLSQELDITIPKVVEEEATAKKEYFDAKMIQSMIEEGKIRVKSVKKDGTVEELMGDFNMDEGEAAVLRSYKKNTADLIATDDGQLIKAAKVMGIPFVNSISFLVRAKEKGILDEDIALEKLRKLEKFGWYKARIIEDAEERIKGG
ncbi:MAG: hypothetical protein V5A88_09105 [Candidatus Thermoplasmatota archaeon]